MGKTALAQRLAREFLSPFMPICLDWFILPSTDDPSETPSCSTPEGIDFELLMGQLRRLRRDLSVAPCVPRQWLAGTEDKDIVQAGLAGAALNTEIIIVVVEGHLLFHADRLCTMFDAHIWLEADIETCLRRRSQRLRPKNPAADAKLFREEIWPPYMRYRQAQLANASTALTLFGNATLDDSVLKSAAYCRSQMRQSIEKTRRLVRKRPLPERQTFHPLLRRVAARITGRMAVLSGIKASLKNSKAEGDEPPVSEPTFKGRWAKPQSAHSVEEDTSQMEKTPPAATEKPLWKGWSENSAKVQTAARARTVAEEITAKLTAGSPMPQTVNVAKPLFPTANVAKKIPQVVKPPAAKAAKPLWKPQTANVGKPLWRPFNVQQLASQASFEGTEEQDGTAWEETQEHAEETAEEALEEDSERTKMSLDEACWFARGSLKASLQRWLPPGEEEDGDLAAEDQQEEEAEDEHQQQDATRSVGPKPPAMQPPAYLLKRANSSQYSDSTWQAAAEGASSEATDGSAWHQPAKKAAYWQRQRVTGGSAWSTPQEDDFHESQEAYDEGWGDSSLQDAENEPETAENMAEEVEHDMSTRPPNGSKAIRYSKDGRMLIQSRGGTVRLFGSNDGTASAPPAMTGNVGGHGKEGAAAKGAGAKGSDWAAQGVTTDLNVHPAKMRPKAVQGKLRCMTKEELHSSEEASTTPETLLRRAVSFLTKPQTPKMTWDQKRVFLKNQGLNEDQIKEARQRAEWAGAVSEEE